MLMSLVLAFQVMAGGVQVNNPPYIPYWMGIEPVKFCITPDMEKYRPEVLKALGVWQTFMLTGFVEAKNCEETRTIAFRQQPMYGNLALGMSPAPLTMEPWAGDIWLNSSLDWNSGLREYLVSVLAHEVGHGLGMPHLYSEEDLMYPIMNKKEARLSLREKKMVLCLYRGMCYSEFINWGELK